MELNVNNGYTIYIYIYNYTKFHNKSSTFIRIIFKKLYNLIDCYNFKSKGKQYNIILTHKSK